MDPQKMAKQMIDFQKATFTNTYNTMSTFQEQSERFVTTFMEQNPMLPQQSKEALQEWVKMCKKARDDYKKAVDESFKNLEKYFDTSSQSQSS